MASYDQSVVDQEPRLSVRTFRHAALETGIEGIATEECHQLRLVSKALIVCIVVAYRLEPRNAAHRLSGARLDVVDIVVVQNA